ncbi:uncharacterized protein LOC135388444 isoform X2 [Ornithodoros turicata]|uniref:uncharacterized protein LOC135388444 isoform X2 n=1 Tax=Ornithodoros turicata TaxID=34597 RepID=UPI00313964B7
MSNISRKKPPVESLLENLRTLKRKHKQILRKNKALTKSQAALKQKLTEQCKALNRKRKIFSIHFPRLKSRIEDNVNALQTVTLNEIQTSLELLGQSLDPDGSLSLTPVELPEGKDLWPPGSHLQTNASVIYKEEEEEQQPEKTEELPVHSEWRALDNDVQTSTPTCPPKPSRRGRSGRSIAPGTSPFRLSLGNRRNSKRIQQTTSAEPRPSTSSQKSDVLGNQSVWSVTPLDFEQPPAHEHPQDAPHEDPQDTPRDSSKGTLKRKHKQSLRKNKALAKSLAASKQKLAEQCKALNREHEIFSIHFSRLKSRIEDKVNALQNEMKSSLELLEQSLDPDGSLFLTPMEITELEELPEGKDLWPPGSHLQTNASVIYKEEEEEQQPEKTEELPVHSEWRALDNEVQTSTPICPPSRSGRSGRSIAPGTSPFRLSSKRIQQMTPAEPRPSTSSQKSDVLGNQSDIEQPPAHEHPQDAPHEDPQDTPRDSSKGLNSLVRRAK